MTEGNDIPGPMDAGAPAEGAPPGSLASLAGDDAAASAPGTDRVQPYDFKDGTLLSARELRKLRKHQEEFASALAGRLSLLLRLEFSLELKRLQTISFQKLKAAWGNPSHLSMFKAEPLRGVGILEIPPVLGQTIVDRLMGGPGQPPETPGEMSEIESALLEQAVQLVVGEWCAHWSKLKDLKPALLGHESNGRFIQTTTPETSMLAITLDARLGECAGQLLIGFPWSALEGLIRQLGQGAETAQGMPAAAPAPAVVRWNSCLDDVRLPVSAGWQGLELAARQVVNLKVGDVLPLNTPGTQTVQLRLGNQTKFHARLGTVSGDWAVEITAKTDR